MVKLVDVPRYSDIRKRYGDPDADGDFQFDPVWLQKRTEVFKLPYALVASWDKSKEIRYLRLHKDVGGAVCDCLEAIEEIYGSTLFDSQWNVLGDALNLRPMKSTATLSTHAWGIAIDLNNHIACWQCPKETQPSHIVEVFKNRGFIWGGDFPAPYLDPMHFQAAGM